MAYTALYRKLRPGTFDGVIGQTHIVRTLKNQLQSGRISHAYLFCGTRGTGKTTTAKVFAKAVNCLAPAEGEPCGVCDACKAIDSGLSMNVVEIDAASNNGVDNIRDLREEVKYAPAVGTYKVYIIDEVHMLSAGAFNALLKTLEEPPPHVVFILATTDPQKIPATILSRCQRFDFRRISSRDMVDTLKGYMEGESVAVTDEALAHVARTSDGAMRDALSLLDQCISFYYNEEITLDKVLDMTGSADDSAFFAMADALLAKDAAACMTLIDDAALRGRDFNRFTTELLAHLRNLLISLSAADSETALDVSADKRKSLAEQAKKAAPSWWMDAIAAFSELLSRLKYASNDRMLLEVCCIRLCSAAPQVTSSAPADEALLARLEKMERALKQSTTPAPAQAVKAQPAADSKPAAAFAKKAMPEDIKKARAGWKTFVKGFPPPEGSFLADTDAGYLNTHQLYVVCGSIGAVTLLKKKNEVIATRLQEAYSAAFDLQFITRTEYEANHRRLFGGEDDFSAADAVSALQKDIHMEITVE